MEDETERVDEREFASVEGDEEVLFGVSRIRAVRTAVGLGKTRTSVGEGDGGVEWLTLGLGDLAVVQSQGRRNEQGGLDFWATV